jgi:hypothetical protein
MNKDSTKYVDINLGDKTLLVHERDGVGEFVGERCIATTTAGLERVFGQREPLRIAI